MALDVSVGLSSVVDDLLDFTKALRVPTLSQLFYKLCREHIPHNEESVMLEKGTWVIV